MHYVSTRADKAAASTTPQQFCDILLGGLAPDGGLYLPSEYPQVTGAELDAWRKLSYADLAFEILRKFATDIPEKDLKALVKKTYTADVYCNARKGEKAADITPLRVLEKDGDKTLMLQALSNGPTLAFKDMAMQLLGNLFEYALGKTGAELNIFGATSGDTGSAAEYAMRGKQGIRVFMLSPHKKMSAFQSAQMFSLQDPNIFNIAVEGVFDDCQDLVKAVSNDLPFKVTQKIGTVNSINWARVVAQVVYYFRGYLAATTDNTQKVSFTVPSGNFGNICAGHIARMMGLPIDRLVAATNENDVLDEFSAPASTACASRPRRITPAARRWTSRKRPTSSASSTTWWAATPSACAHCFTRWKRRAASTCRANLAAMAMSSSWCRSTVSSPANRPTRTASTPFATSPTITTSLSTPTRPMGSRSRASTWRRACR